MHIQKQFFCFYRLYLKKISTAITNGQNLIFVGINAIGKNILAQQIFSNEYRNKFFPNRKIFLIPLNFKDKYSPTSEQIYKYWTLETAKELGIKINENEVFNEFFFYSRMSEMIKNLHSDEKISFILLDFQNILNQNEAFFKSLIYLHLFSHGKASFIILSEPQILECPNYWAQVFIQQMTGNKYHFLKTYNQKTIIANIKRQEKILKGDLMKYRSIIIRYSKGLHGVIDAFCRILNSNPKIGGIRKLIKLAYDDKLCQYWVKDVLNSLPKESVKILREVAIDKNRFKKYKKNKYGKWLVELGLLKKNGTLRFTLILPILNQYMTVVSDESPLIKIGKDRIILRGEEAKVTHHELLILKTLYRNKGKLVTFDKLGEVLWNNNPDKFSLWAISQTVRRLRKTFSYHSINPNIISSQRGEGYRLD